MDGNTTTPTYTEEEVPTYTEEEVQTTCKQMGGGECQIWNYAEEDVQTGTQEEEVQTGTQTSEDYGYLYSCSTGTLSGETCTTTSTTPATQGSTYWCATGTLTGSSCVMTSTVAATETLTCPTGDELDGTNCTAPSSPPPATSPSGGSGSTSTSIPPTGSPVATYSASAIATAGGVFTATSDVSQAEAQATANSEATAYDSSHPTVISTAKTTHLTVSPATPTSHTVVGETVTVANAPDKANGEVVAELLGPIAKSAGACRTATATAFTKAKRTAYKKAIVGSGSFMVSGPTPKTAGCYAWESTVTYVGGAKVQSDASGKSSVFVR